VISVQRVERCLAVHRFVGGGEAAEVGEPAAVRDGVDGVVGGICRAHRQRSEARWTSSSPPQCSRCPRRGRWPMTHVELSKGSAQGRGRCVRMRGHLVTTGNVSAVSVEDQLDADRVAVVLAQGPLDIFANAEAMLAAVGSQ
jgi:hypothetical protein